MIFPMMRPFHRLQVTTASTRPSFHVPAGTKRTASGKNIKALTRRSGRSKKATFTKRRVRFQARISVREIPHILDLTDEEVETVWFQRFEYHKIRKDVSFTMRLMAQGDDHALDTDPNICTRGLEWKLREHLPDVSKSELQQKGTTAVFSEQRRQQQSVLSMPGSGPERIAIVYRGATQGCQQLAHTMALLDAQAALSILSESVLVEVDPSFVIPYCKATSSQKLTTANHYMTTSIHSPPPGRRHGTTY